MDESLTNKPKNVKLVIMIGLPIIIGLLSAFLTCCRHRCRAAI